MSEQTKKVEVTFALPKEAKESSTELTKTVERKDNPDREERKEIREADRKEKERKEGVDSKQQQEARDRAQLVWKQLMIKPKCCLDTPFICKKIILLLLVALEIAVLIYWALNPTAANFEELIAPILLVGILFTLILLLGNTIAKEEQEQSKAKAEMLKEAFMRRLK